MVWRRLPNVVLKQRQSIGTYKQLLQNQIRQFSTTNNNNSNNSSGDNNNNNNNNNDGNNENEDDGNLINMALSMQKMKNNNNNKNNNKGSPTTTSTNENNELNDNLEEEEDYTVEIESYLNTRLNENGDLLTDDGELTELTFDEISESDRINMIEVTTNDTYIGTPISKNEKAVKIEFIKAFSKLNPRSSDDFVPFSEEQFDQFIETLSKQEDYTLEEKGESLSYSIKYPLTDSTRNDIILKFIQNYKANGEQLYRQYITSEQVGNFGLLKKDYSSEYPPYVDRINGNVMVYDDKASAYKYYSNVYSNDADKYSTEQVLRSRFFNDDIVIVSKYLKSSPRQIRDAILTDEKLFDQVVRVIHLDQKSNANAQGVPEVDLSKQAEAIARAARDTGLISDKAAGEIYSTREEEYQFMDNPSNFYNKQMEREQAIPKPKVNLFNKNIQDMNNDNILKQADVNLVPELSVDGIRGEHLKDQLSQYYLDLSRRELPKPVSNKLINEQQDIKYKPIPSGYEIYDAPVEDVLPSKPSQVDNFNPDFYRDFIQYRVLAMPHENLRMNEVIDAFKEEKDFQDLINADNRIKRDEVKFFMENYLNKDFEVDFDKIQNDLESLYYKPITSSSSSSPSSLSSSKATTNNTYIKEDNQDILNSSIVSSVLNIQNHLNNNNNNNNNNNISNTSDKIGNIELNDQEDSPLSENYTVPTDLDNPSEQDDTNIDAELFLDSDETLTLDADALYDHEGAEEVVDFARDHDVVGETNQDITEDVTQDITEDITNDITEDITEETTEEMVEQEQEEEEEEHNDLEVANEQEDQSIEQQQFENGEENTEDYQDESSEVTSSEYLTEGNRLTFREEGKGISQTRQDFNDPFLDQELANINTKDGDGHQELPQYLTKGDELFVQDMEEYTDSLFLTVEGEENTITFGELDEDDVLLQDDNVEIPEEERKLVPFEVDFGKIQDGIDANRSKLSKEDLLQSIQEEFGMNYYDGIAHDKVIEELKQRLSPESFTFLMDALESVEDNEIDTNQPELSSEDKSKLEQITNEIKQLNGEDNVKESINSYDNIDEDYEDEEEEDESITPEDEEEGYQGIGFRYNEDNGDLDLVHPEGIQQFEDAIEEMELFDLMEGTYEEDLDLLRAEADMYVKRNEKKIKVLAKRRAFAKQMRDKQLEQNKINPPVKVPYVIPTLPTGKNIYTSVLAPPNSYLKLQTIRNQPPNKQSHKEIIQESYRALSSNAFYGAKEAEFAVKKIHKELSNAEGYKKYRKHSKLTSKPVQSPILSKPDLLVETEKLHDFNPLYRNN